MNKEIDARGLNCPMPLIQTKKALDALPEGSVRTIVDNETAKENIQKFAKSMDYRYTVKENQGNFYIDIFKELKYREMRVLDLEMEPESFPKSDLVVMISKDYLGEGSEELGRILMKGYLYTLTEVLPMPKTLVFVNSGVKLTCAGSDSLDNLRKLEENGVEILSCGTCLDYFKLKSMLMVGGISNMYTIVEHLNKAKNTLQL
ncbi:sulfurtransferase-like selenium metabolism protein YedF [Anoxynatronum buryatiense]|uniref:Selenium metabolism protein YedF n=1 Tax=Anoxynatronum buryatiense TaxID=489973 RepID=A0AA45WXH9_9CLOT|nr:sulfurtransferase-like selenium metabolism protein YedF [Anoxynatronum buryatiense]SMP59101.1 selenium metabolism protein YedF [Anoxynatronum buryatiense]